MLDIDALTERILLVGHGKILLDGSLDELKKHTFTDKKITVKYTGNTPNILESMKLLESKANQMTISLKPNALLVSTAIAALAS